MMSPAQAQDTSALHWHEANHTYLHTQLARLRLLLRRRVLWLRQQWQQDELQSYQGLLISNAQADLLLAGDNSRTEGNFYLKDATAAAFSRSLVQLERESARQVQALAQLGQAPAVEVLVHLFGLTDFERDVLLLCLAPELDPSFPRLYAYVQNDATCKYATPHLALSLCAGESWLAAKESFMPHGHLRRFCLITLDSGAVSALPLGACPLRLEERIASYLLGVNRLDERLATLLHPVAPAPLTPEQESLLDRLQGWIEVARRQGPWPVLNLVGPPGVGKSALARALCERLQLQLYSLHLVQLPGPGAEQRATLRLLEREAILSQFALYLDAVGRDDSAPSPPLASLDPVLQQLRVFLLLGSQEQWQTERTLLTVHVPQPNTNAQRALWQRALAGIPHTLNSELDVLVQQFAFGPLAISRAIATAQSQARLRAFDDSAPLTVDDLWHACREQVGWRLEDLAQRITPCHTWEDIVLPEDVQRQLQEIAAQVTHRSQVYEAWGFGAKLNRGRGISVLFAGPSGTGKTMAAEILANHLRLSLYRIDLSGVVSKYIGETEKNLRKVFDAAEQSGAILLFDEADALFGKRSEVKDSHDRYANIEVNYLLQRMEDYRGLAILATNMKSHLDQAFLRRLRFLVDFPFPDAAHRVRIWQRVFPPQAAVEGLDYTVLSRLEIAGGNIKNIALNAAFLAATDGGAIHMEHLLQAARREYVKIDKLMLEAEFGSYYAMVKR
jgi:ATP-dependent 26S proteasome regulatory subunit